MGTVFRRANQTEILADLKRPKEIFLAARGGAGGRGNKSFLSNANRTPLCAENGGIGEVFEYDIELRVMAHAGLVSIWYHYFRNRLKKDYFYTKKYQNIKPRWNVIQQNLWKQHFQCNAEFFENFSIVYLDFWPFLDFEANFH